MHTNKGRCLSTDLLNLVLYQFVKLLTFNLPPPGPSSLKEIFVSSGGNKNLVLEGDKIASFGGSARHVLNVKC